MKLLITFQNITVASKYSEAVAANVLQKKTRFKNFAKFTRKHLCQFFFNKLAGLEPTILLKKRLWHRCDPVNFAKF